MTLCLRAIATSNEVLDEGVASRSDIVVNDPSMTVHLGRNKHTNIACKTVSRKICCVYVQHGEWRVTGHCTSSLFYVNGNAIHGKHIVSLQQGDTIALYQRSNGTSLYAYEVVGVEGSNTKTSGGGEDEDKDSDDETQVLGMSMSSSCQRHEQDCVSGAARAMSAHDYNNEHQDNQNNSRVEPTTHHVATQQHLLHAREFCSVHGSKSSANKKVQQMLVAMPKTTSSITIPGQARSINQGPSKQPIRTKRARDEDVMTPFPDITCPICLELLVATELVIPCGHAFCQSCVPKHGACPMCYANIEGTVMCKRMDAVTSFIVANFSHRVERDDVDHYHERVQKCARQSKKSNEKISRSALPLLLTGQQRPHAARGPIPPTIDTRSSESYDAVPVASPIGRHPISDKRRVQTVSTRQRYAASRSSRPNSKRINHPLSFQAAAEPARRHANAVSLRQVQGNLHRQGSTYKTAISID